MSKNIIIYKNKLTNHDAPQVVNQKPIPISVGNLVTLDKFLTSKQEPVKQKIVMNVYCDGSTINNGRKNSAGGIGVFFGMNDPRNISEPFLIDVPTNQKTELYAMIRTLRILNSMIGGKVEYMFYIYSDSEYTINCMTKWIPTWMKNNWRKSDGKEVKNVALLKELAKEYLPHQRHFQIRHVRSHTGLCEGNTYADQLAVGGSKMHPNYGKP